MRPSWRRPGIHNPESWLWIPGSRLKQARPGMTATKLLLATAPQRLFLRLLGADDVGQLDAVILAPHVGKPVPHVAAQHKGIVLGLVLLALVGDEFQEWHRGDLDLLIGHFVKLRDGEFGG